MDAPVVLGVWDAHRVVFGGDGGSELLDDWHQSNQEVGAEVFEGIRKEQFETGDRKEAVHEHLLVGDVHLEVLKQLLEVLVPVAFDDETVDFEEGFVDAELEVLDFAEDGTDFLGVVAVAEDDGRAEQGVRGQVPGRATRDGVGQSEKL